MRLLRWTVALLLPGTPVALWCYETTCIDDDDAPPCVTADAAVTRLRNCGALGLEALPPPEGGGSYDRCLRTQVEGAVDYTTPADDGISYYACGSSGGYFCDSEESAWEGGGVLISETAMNSTNTSETTSNASAIVRTSRWCCSGEKCNEPTQAKIDRLAAEVAALAAAYTTEPTLGFEYLQAPTWSPQSCSMDTVGAADAMYVPIIDLAFDVGEVGRCKAFNRRARLEDILAYYIGNGQAKTMDWAFMGHCVECDTMPGDGRSPFAVREGRTSAIHYFYASDDCSELTLLYTQEYTLGRSSSTCLPSPSLDGTGYIARCGDPSIGTCPKPPGDGFSIMEYPDGSCQLPVNRLLAWNASLVGQCVSEFGSTRPDFLPSTVHSAKVCCTSQSATLYYYSDGGCSTPHDPNTDKLELGLLIDLRVCKRQSLSLLSHSIATCSSVQTDCPPLDEQEYEESSFRRQVISESVDTVANESDDPTVGIIVVSAVLLTILALWLTKPMWMSDAQQAKLDRIMHGTKAEDVTERRSYVPKEMTEKDKIVEQYRTKSFQDGVKPHADHLKTNSEPVLPGTATSCDEHVEDPLVAAQLATKAAEHKTKLKRSKSYHDQSQRARSSSHRSKVKARGSTREGSHRSSSTSVRESKSYRKDKSGSRSSGPAKDRTRKAEQLKSNSEGRRRVAMQHSLKEMKSLEESKTRVGPDKRRDDSIVTCRKLFDRIDVDGSGTLDRNEISMLATKMGRGLRTEELDAAMSAMDKDGNGTVDFDEFYTWYSGSSRAMGKAEVKVLAYLKRSRDA